MLLLRHRGYHLDRFSEKFKRCSQLQTLDFDNVAAIV
jgi:hypothetical protein